MDKPTKLRRNRLRKKLVKAVLDITIHPGRYEGMRGCNEAYGPRTADLQQVEKAKALAIEIQRLEQKEIDDANS